MSFGPWQFGMTEAIAIGQTGAALLIAWWARGSVREWLKKRAAIRKVEVAEKCLALMYEAEDAFRYIRFSGGSIPYAELKLKVNEQADAEFQRGMDRIKVYDNYFEKVTSQLPITKAFVGEDIYNGLREILLIRNAIMYALEDRRELSREEPSTGSLEDRRKQDDGKRARANECRRVIYGNFDENDAIYKRYSKALDILNVMLLPIIRGEKNALP